MGMTRRKETGIKRKLERFGDSLLTTVLCDLYGDLGHALFNKKIERGRTNATLLRYMKTDHEFAPVLARTDLGDVRKAGHYEIKLASIFNSCGYECVKNYVKYTLYPMLEGQTKNK